MQRQSLGSPSSSKLVKEDQLQPPSQSSSTPFYGEECREEEEKDELKKLKLKTSTPQSYIHLIPLLTLFCFLILYLSSHDPSLNDLADFNGFKSTLSKPKPAELHENISELQRILETEKGDNILPVRSINHAAKRRRLHRKIAHF